MLFSNAQPKNLDQRRATYITLTNPTFQTTVPVNLKYAGDSARCSTSCHFHPRLKNTESSFRRNRGHHDSTASILFPSRRSNWLKVSTTPPKSMIFLLSNTSYVSTGAFAPICWQCRGATLIRLNFLDGVWVAHGGIKRPEH